MPRAIEHYAELGGIVTAYARSIISGTGKATDFKFSQYIQRVHPNKSP